MGDVDGAARVLNGGIQLADALEALRMRRVDCPDVGAQRHARGRQARLAVALHATLRWGHTTYKKITFILIVNLVFFSIFGLFDVMLAILDVETQRHARRRQARLAVALHAALRWGHTTFNKVIFILS